MTTTKGRHGDRTDVEPLHLGDKSFQPTVNVLHSGVASPVPLCWEVDDVLRSDHAAGRYDKHAAGDHFAGCASPLVNPEVLWERLLELERNPFAHEPAAVDGIDECLDIRLQKIAFT
jgi:hypothetical protein